jgi:hypothetical protein
VGWDFTQGGGLGGLALGYYQAAPPGLQGGEPNASAAGWASRLHCNVTGPAWLR